jgi:uncharacterized protein
MKNQHSLNKQVRLIHELVEGLENECGPVQIFETHISWVLVMEEIAYKFKKALQFDFVDFSTLEKRHFYCQEELRLNRRLAPDLYLGIVTVTGSAKHPLIDGSGTPIEFGVKMRAFPQQALWNQRLATGTLSAMEIDSFAKKIAWFHQETARISADSEWGMPNLIQKTADDNLSEIASLLKEEPEKLQQVREIKLWQDEQHRNLSFQFEIRKRGGMIKECHGDLHSGNILTANDQVAVFDCIEFNPYLRWIDVINDIAFISMDLEFHGKRHLGARLLNGYLEITGDYEGVSLLRYYQIQRALVRCKVSLLRVRQLDADAPMTALLGGQAREYLAYSLQSIRPAPAVLMITHGYSGSGKSMFSRCLVELVGAIQIRSDVERKRLHGLSAASKAAAPFEAGLYQPEATEKTYDRLRQLAGQVIGSGLPVIVDAAFLKKEQRQLFEKLAHDLGVPFFIFDLRAKEATLQQRIVSRTKLGLDPSDAGLEVLAHQIAEHDPLSEDEITKAIVVDCEPDMTIESIRKVVVPIIELLQKRFA